MKAQPEIEHCQRVAQACSLAVKHVALLFSESTQKFVEEILADGPAHREQSLTKIRRRIKHLEHLEGEFMRRCDAEIGLLRALEFLVSRLWNDSVWWTRKFHVLLGYCWNHVAEAIDMKNWRCGERWMGENGPLASGEQDYHREVVIPLIEESFRTMWNQQDEKKKTARKHKQTKT